MQSAAKILEQQSMIHSGIQKQAMQQVPVKMNTNNPMSSTCNATDSNKKRIETLFTRFAVFYGHVWRSQFKSEGFLEFAKKEWLEGLNPFSDDILNQAILECRSCQSLPSAFNMISTVFGSCNALSIKPPKSRLSFSFARSLTLNPGSSNSLMLLIPK